MNTSLNPPNSFSFQPVFPKTGVTKAAACSYPLCRMVHIKDPLLQPAQPGTCARDRRALQQLALNVHVKLSDLTGPDGAVAKSSVNGLVGTGFASRSRFQ